MGLLSRSGSQSQHMPTRTIPLRTSPEPFGFDRGQGVLRGVHGWRAAGYEASTYKVVDVPSFARRVEQ